MFDVGRAQDDNPAMLAMTAVGVLIMIPVTIIVLAILIQSLQRATERTKGHDKCSFCRARLKKTSDGGHFATTCSKCARLQPWA